MMVSTPTPSSHTAALIALVEAATPDMGGTPTDQILRAKDAFQSAYAVTKEFAVGPGSDALLEQARTDVAEGVKLIITATKGAPSLPLNDALLALGSLDTAVARYGEESIDGSHLLPIVENANAYLAGLAR